VRDAGEAPGVIVGVMFRSNGTMVTQNPRTDSNRIFVDFASLASFASSEGWGQRQAGTEYDLAGSFPDNTSYCDLGTAADGTRLDHYFCQADGHDEPYITLAPVLAVYDDADARQRFDTSTWGDARTRIDDLSRYLADRADPLHFNRYSGVAMR